MSELVVDTNVWVMVDGDVTGMITADERECILACQSWLESFIRSHDRLAVDSFATHRILSEYRRNVRPGGIAESLLNELTGRLFHRLAEKEVQLDADGFAILPAPFHLTHAKDRIFVAVAIQCSPFATIFYATDTDWAADQAELQSLGLQIVGLCPSYIERRLREG